MAEPDVVPEEAPPLTERDLLQRIAILVDDGNRLQRGHDPSPLSALGIAQLTAIRTELDQCWDQLRQRRARRRNRVDPNAPHPSDRVGRPRRDGGAFR